MDLVVIGFGATWYEYDSKKEEFFWNIQKKSSRYYNIKRIMKGLIFIRRNWINH